MVNRKAPKAQVQRVSLADGSIRYFVRFVGKDIAYFRTDSAHFTMWSFESPRHCGPVKSQAVRESINAAIAAHKDGNGC